MLETEFETESGAVRLIDFMPFRDGTPAVIRVVRGLRGHVANRARDPRMVGTSNCIEERLLEKGFIHRFLHPSLQGRRREARKVMDRLLALRNDVGLLQEEYDPKAKRFLRNFR